MANILSENQCIQYTDDFTIYSSWEKKDLKICSTEVKNELHAMLYHNGKSQLFDKF